MNTGANGIYVMHHYEQCRLKAYKPVPTDPWTCGWGCTGKDSEGNVIDEHTEWTQEKADHEFEWRLAREFEPGVEAMVTGGASQAQFDALVAFAFNVGIGNLKTSTLLRLHNAGDVAGAAAQFARWNKSAGQVLKGLSRRRAAEAAVYRGVGAQQAIKMALELFP